MKKLIYVVSALLFASCSSKIVKKDRLDQLKKVAIIGLDIEQQKSVSGIDLMSIALKQSSTDKMVAGVREESLHASAVYEDLSHKISAKTGWKVMSLDELKSSKAYAKLFKEKTEGFQSRPLINERFDLFVPNAVLDVFAIQSLKEDELKALAQALRVDAVIMAKSVVHLNNSSIFASLVGKGEFHPSSTSNLYVIDATTGEKIFLERADGPELETGEKNFAGMASETKLNELAREATGLSLDKVIKDL